MEDENRLLKERLEEDGVSYADIVSGDAEGVVELYDPDQGARIKKFDVTDKIASDFFMMFCRGRKDVYDLRYLGMTKGALYRHYESKRDIFEHIVKRMEQGDGEQAESHDMPADKKENEPEQYEEISTDNFVEYSKSMFSYWTENDFASSFRKMLTLEQFRNEEMQALYQQYLVSGPVEYVKDLFKSMEIVEEDKKATMFYSIMFFYYSLYDGAKDKTRIKEQFEKSISGLI